MKTYTLHVSGMHCASCKILIEDILGEQANVSSVSVDIKNQTIDVEINDDVDAHSVAGLFTSLLSQHGYSVSVGNVIHKEKSNGDIWKALPLGILFLVLFFILQKSGILNFGIGGAVTPVTSFLIGVVASLSSCLAVVGGLVLSFSASIAEGGAHNKKPLILFHIGRIVGFALLGAVLGLIGEAFGINYIISGILGITASAVMILLGINLLGLFKSGSFTLPSSVFTFFRKAEHQAFTPLLIGVSTFFLPCGFTQSMQVAALSSGSIVSGSLIMFFFALGTFPVLALVSFGSMSFSKSKHTPLFFKTIGVIVIGLGFLALVAGLAGLGIINPLFTF